MHDTTCPFYRSFQKVVWGFFLMHIGALFYLKRNFHFLHVKQQWKCPQKFTLSPTGGKDLLFAGNYLMLSTCLRSLGMIFFFFFCSLPGAAEPWILDFVHSGPFPSQGQKEDVVQLSSCRCQLSAEGRVKWINPHF